MISLKFRKIYDELAGEIISGNFEIGSYLPSEPRLSAYYQVSRETIRKALNLLTQEGMIKKIKGKGSIVLGQPIIGDSNTLVAKQTIKKQFPHEEYKLIEFSPTVLSVKQFIKDPNELLDKVSFYKVGEVCFIDKIPSFLKYTYIVTDFFPNLQEEDIQGSFENLIRTRYDLSLGFIKREIVIETAEFLEAPYLDVQAGNPLGVIKDKTYINNSDLLMLTTTKYSPQNFRYTEFINK